MAAITRPHHMGLQVADLERSLSFYRDILGFELVFRWNPREPYIGQLVGYPEVDLHAAILRPPSSEVFLELMEYRSVERMPVDARTANPGTAHMDFPPGDSDRGEVTAWRTYRHTVGWSTKVIRRRSGPAIERARRQPPAGPG